MANLTIFEFDGAAVPGGDAPWPADLVTTTTTASTVNLRATTRTFIICADADCRLMINGPTQSAAASASALPVLSAVPNQFRVAPTSGQTLKFA